MIHICTALDHGSPRFVLRAFLSVLARSMPVLRHFLIFDNSSFRVPTSARFCVPIPQLLAGHKADATANANAFPNSFLRFIRVVVRKHGQAIKSSAIHADAGGHVSVILP